MLEYKRSDDVEESTLNAMAAKGWRLVTVMQPDSMRHPTLFNGVFEREKKKRKKPGPKPKKG